MIERVTEPCSAGRAPAAPSVFRAPEAAGLVGGIVVQAIEGLGPRFPEIGKDQRAALDEPRKSLLAEPGADA